jgi:hypothetical protein
VVCIVVEVPLTGEAQYGARRGVHAIARVSIMRSYFGGSSSRSYGDDEEPDEEQASLLGDAAARGRGMAERIGLVKPKPPPSRFAACCPDLSYSTRLSGFAFCFILGNLLSLFSLTSFSSLLLGNPFPFAFKYTVGNVLSLTSYCFLSGPRQQCASMFSSERWIFTTCYLGSFAATLICVFYLHSWLGTLVAIVIQFCAMFCYALSTIAPYLGLPPSMGLGILRRMVGM